MADWTDLSDAAVGIGGIPSGTTVTALRDNVVALAEQVAGSPFVDTPYDIQAFTSSGTWTKPADAVSGDRVWVFLYGGGGGGGARNFSGTVASVYGGAGGAGILYPYQEIDLLGATEGVTIGAGGAGGSISVGTGSSSGTGGGTSVFGTSSTDYALTAGGGGGGGTLSAASGGGANIYFNARTNSIPGDFGSSGQSSTNSDLGLNLRGGGAGGSISSNLVTDEGYSIFAGNGGAGDGGAGSQTGLDGCFPSGGGGCASSSTSGAVTNAGNGAAGYCLVLCFRGYA